MSDQPTTAAIIDDFRGDNAHLRECIRALISMNDDGALVPHGIGGHARALLCASYHRLAHAPLESSPAAKGHLVSCASLSYQSIPCDCGADQAASPGAGEPARSETPRVDVPAVPEGLIEGLERLESAFADTEYSELVKLGRIGARYVVAADSWITAHSAELSALRAEVEKIKRLATDSNAVHVNMLRGTLARLSWEQTEHLLGPHPLRAEVERLNAIVARIIKETPAGYVPNHTEENLPDIVAGWIKEAAEECRRADSAESRESALRAALGERNQQNRRIRDSIDELLEQGGYHPESSARHQLSMLNFDDLTAPEPARGGFDGWYREWRGVFMNELQARAVFDSARAERIATPPDGKEVEGE